MKTISLFIYLTLFLQIVGAQDYSKTLGDTNIWNVVDYWGEGSGVINYATKGDIIINDTSYKILGYEAKNQITEFGYLREDTINKKIFIKPNKQWTQIEKEFVYIDYSLEKGDSIFLYNVSNLTIDTLGYYYVDSVCQTQVLIGSRKTIFLRSKNKIIHNYSNNYQYPIWIEGIGSLSSPFVPHSTPNADKFDDYGENEHYYHDNELTCSFVDDIQVYQSEFTLSVGCEWFHGWGAIKEQQLDAEITIYPNPVHDWVHFENLSIDSYVCEIYSLVGKKEFSFNLLQKESKQIDVSYLAPGIYLVKITSSKGTLGFKRLVR